MTEQEQFSVNIQRQIDAQNARIDSVMAKVDMLVVESQQQREDIRRAQEKHDADMKEINKKIDDKFDKISSQLQMMAVTTILGVGAIVWAIVSAVK